MSSADMALIKNSGMLKLPRQPDMTVREMATIVADGNPSKKDPSGCFQQVNGLCYRQNYGYSAQRK